MRLTMRGKAVLAVISIFIIGFSVFLSVRPGFAVKKNSSPDYVFYTVKSDDTLWSIAQEYTEGRKDVRKTLYEIKKVNDVKEEELKAGMRLAIFK